MPTHPLDSSLPLPLLALLFASACASGAGAGAGTGGTTNAVAETRNANAVAELRNAAGESVGEARLTQNAAGPVELAVQVHDLSPGRHGIHFHATGSCDAPSFESAGAHYSPPPNDAAKHGLSNPEGPHNGDLPNLEVSADGSGRLSTATDRVTLGPDGPTLFDADGTALVIHAKEDDQRTDPSGNSGDRVACGRVEER
jgi:Cu-Zn family superoxide dismutase